MRTALNLQIAFSNTNLLVHMQVSSLHLLMSYLVTFFSVLQFSLCSFLISAVGFIARYFIYLEANVYGVVSPFPSHCLWYTDRALILIY